LKNQGYDVENLCLASRPKKFEDVNGQEKRKLVSLFELLGRIPETQSIFVDVFHRQPFYLFLEGKPTVREEDSPDHEYTLDFSPSYNTEFLEEENIIDILPFVQVVEQGGHYCAKVKKKDLANLKFHDSAMCKRSYIKPLFEVIDDYLLVNFVAL
jgi:hypothetical protein